MNIQTAELVQGIYHRQKQTGDLSKWERKYLNSVLSEMTEAEQAGCIAAIIKIMLGRE